MAFGNTVKYVVDVDAKGAVTGISAAADAADKGAGRFKSLDGILQGVKLGMGIDAWGMLKGAVSNLASALPALIDKTGEYAGNLLKTQSAIRATIEGQQILMRAGAEVGVSWETQTGAILKMQVALGKNPQMVEQIGLSFKDLKNLSPEKQYEAIGTAVAKIEDPVQRSAAAVKFFGKAGAEVLPVFEGAIADAAAASQKFALTMSGETVRSVDRLSDNLELGGDALEAMGRNFVGAIASSEPFQLLVEGILDAVGWFSRELKTNENTIKQWVSTGVLAALYALQMLGPAIGWVIDAFAGLGIGLAVTIRVFKDVAAGAVFAATSMLDPIGAARTLNETLKRNAAEMDASISANMKTNSEWQAKLKAGNGVLETFIAKVEAGGGAHRTAEKATQSHGREIGEAGKATAQAAKDWETFVSKVGGADLTKALDKYSRAIAEGIKLTPEATKDLAQTIDKAVAAGLKVSDPALTKAAAEYRAKETAAALAAAVDKALADLPKTDVWKFLDPPKNVSETLEKELRAVEKAVDDLDAAFDAGKISVDVYAARLAALGRPLDAATLAQLRFAESIEKLRDKAGLIGAVGDLFVSLGIRGGASLQKISDGMAAGINAAENYAKAMSTSQKAMVLVETASYALENGMKAGAAAGATLGFTMGGPLGAGIGAAAGALLGWIGNNKRAQEEARRLSAEIEKNRQAFIDSAGGLDALNSKALAAGYTLDRLFVAKTVKDYEAAVKELTDAFALQERANELLNAAMERYGITIDQLGPKFSQQRLDQQAMDLLRDYELLIAAGVDHTLVIEKMGPAMNQYVQTAQAAGASLPESLRPMIEKMIELGLLTDAAGNKITDIDDIEFAPTMTEAITAMVAAIKDLTDALLGIPRRVDTTVHTTFTSSGSGPGGGGPDDGGGGGTTPAEARIASRGLSRPAADRAGAASEAPGGGDMRDFARTLAADLARSIGGNAPAIHIYVEPSSGQARQLSPAEARRISAAIGAGVIQVPRRSLSTSAR